MAGNFHMSNFQRSCLTTTHQTKYLQGPGLVPWDPVNWPIMAALCGICYLVAGELLLKVLLRLRNLRGMYLWSLIIGPLGCMIHISGSLLKFFVAGIPWEASTLIILLGWWPMIIGQSLVLYSRLYLVVESKLVLWSIRIMIATTFTCFLIPAPISLFLTNAVNSNPGYDRYFETIEKTQLCGFLLSEMILSCTYIVATWRVLQSNAIVKVKKVVRFLIITNVAIIALDSVVFTMQMLDWYAIQASLKPAVYAIKFSLEYAFLNQLMAITNFGFQFVRDLKQKEASTREGTSISSYFSKLSFGKKSGKDMDMSMSGISIDFEEELKAFPSPSLSQTEQIDYAVPLPSTVPAMPRDYQNFESFHTWEEPEQAVERNKSYGVSVVGDPDRKASVTTSIHSEANRRRSQFSGLKKRPSNEHLGTETEDRVRRAEVGLHDFVARGDEEDEEEIGRAS